MNNEDEYEYCVEVYDGESGDTYRTHWGPHKYLFRNAAQVRPSKFKLLKRLKSGGPEIERNPSDD